MSEPFRLPTGPVVDVLDAPPEQPPADPTFVREAHRIVLYYVQFVRRHRFVLLGVPFAAAVVALAYTWVQPRMYEASVTMMSSGTVPVPTYVPYLQNHRIVDGVMRDFKLADPPHRLTRTQFFESIFAVEAIRNTNLLSMRLRLRDPKVAADVLNRISKDAIDLVRRTNSENSIAIRDILRVQLDEARERYATSTNRLLQYREKSQIELLQRDIDAALRERGQLLALSAEIAEKRSRLNGAQAELLGRARIDTIRRSIDDSPVLLEAARSAASDASTADSRSLLGLELRTDQINTVYAALDTQVATTRAELAGLEQKRDQLVKTEGVAAAQMEKLTRLYNVEAELARLDLEQALRKNVFTEVSNRYELARLDVAKHGELFIVDPALPADRPLARGTVVNVFFATLAGAVLALGIVVIGRKA